MFLSIIIVAKNEEQNISRCIESILNFTKTIESKEILLVDSCSSDRTIDIAKNYLINIIGLRPNWMLSPAAGRFSGINNTTGKYILIIDGDMELLKGWIAKGLHFMENNPNAAAIVGKLYHVYRKNDGYFEQPQIDRYSRGKNKLQKVDYIYGSSIFRRKSLLEAGNFQPYIRAEEEAEISHRLKRKGYELFFLPYNSVYHHCIPQNGLLETKRRIKNKLYSGIGDMVSWCLRRKYYSIIWNRCKIYIIALFFIMINIIGFIYFLVINNYILFGIFGLTPIFFVIFMIFKKKNVSQGILSVLNISIIAVNLIGGFFRKINEISTYPNDVIWINRI